MLGPKPYRVGYVQPSRRPADGRYGENPNRLFKHMQFQVILKPPPADVQDLYLASLAAIGIDLRKHDIKFEEDNWESPTLGAWGIGWQVMLDGLEITQFTYFQQCGGIDLDPISAELTYGLERIAAFLQDVNSIYDITGVVGPDGRPVKYGEIRLQDELQFSVYNFERADVEKAWEHLRLYEAECQALLDQYNEAYSEKQKAKGEERGSGEKRTAKSEQRETKSEQRHRFPVLAAFTCAKCSHLFNILDARGAISVTERVGVITHIRALAVGVAKAYAQRVAAGERDVDAGHRAAGPSRTSANPQLRRSSPATCRAPSPYARGCTAESTVTGPPERSSRSMARSRSSREPRLGDAHVFGLRVVPDVVAACAHRCRRGGPRAHERIEDEVPLVGVELDQAQGELDGERGGVPDARGALARDLPHIGGGLDELVLGQADPRRQPAP